MPKVGDHIYTKSDGIGGGKWCRHTVKKITPTGRLVTGHYTFNADLTIRGRSFGYYGPYSGHLETPEIVEKYKRQTLLFRLGTVQWEDLPTETLQAVDRALREVVEDENE